MATTQSPAASGKTVSVDPAAGRKFRDGIARLELTLERFAGPNLVGYPFRDDAELARTVGALHRVVVRAVVADRSIAEWMVTASGSSYTIIPPAPMPSPAALRAAKYHVLFDWTDFAAVQGRLRGKYVPNTTKELPRRNGEIVAMPYQGERGVILSGQDTFKFNTIEARKSGAGVGQRVTFIERRIHGTAIATDLAVRVAAGSTAVAA